MAMNVSFESARNIMRQYINEYGNNAMKKDVANGIVNDADIAMLVCITDGDSLERAIIGFLNRVRENAMNGMYKQILRAAYVNAAEEVLRRNTKDEGEEA